MWIGHDVRCELFLKQTCIHYLTETDHRYVLKRSSMLERRPFSVSLRSSLVLFLVLEALSVWSRLSANPRLWRFAWLAPWTSMRRKLSVLDLLAKLLPLTNSLTKLSRLLKRLLACHNRWSKWSKNPSINVSVLGMWLVLSIHTGVSLLILSVTSAYELSLASGLRFERRLFQSTFGTVSGKQTLFMQSGWMASNYLPRCRMIKEKEWLLSLKRESQHLLISRIPLVWQFDCIRIVVCDGHWRSQHIKTRYKTSRRKQIRAERRKDDNI